MIQNDRGAKELRDAAKRGQHERLLRIILGHTININTTYGNGWTAAHYAAHRGHSRCVKVMVFGFVALQLT